MPARSRREKEIKARVSDVLKEDVRAFAAARGHDNESIVVTEAVVSYLRTPENQAMVEEGRKLLAARSAERPRRPH